jgi:Domain of unknown function (DUF1937)
MTDFYYLATPYSKYPDGLDAAFVMAAENRDLLAGYGIRCFSPIVFCHRTAYELRLDPHDHSIWLPVCAPIMERAKGLIMLRAPSWEISYGMNEELKLFRAAGKPVLWMDPGIIPEIP